MKRIGVYILCLITICMIAGCSAQNLEGEKEKDLEFTVVNEEEIPKELLEMIQERREQPFQMNFSSEGFLYLVQGYGKQPTGGYSIQVSKLYLAKESIHVEMNLIGPTKDTKVKDEVSYPYIVLKLEARDEPVVYD